MLSGLSIALQGIGFGPAATLFQGFVEVAAAPAFATGGGGGRRRVAQARELNELLRKALAKPKPFAAVATAVTVAAAKTSIEEVEEALEALPSLRELEVQIQVVSSAVIRYARQQLEKLEEAEEEEFIVTQLLLM